MTVFGLGGVVGRDLLFEDPMVDGGRGDIQRD